MTTKKADDGPRPEYDFSKGERGRYVKRFGDTYDINIHGRKRRKASEVDKDTRPDHDGERD